MPYMLSILKETQKFLKKNTILALILGDPGTETSENACA